MQTLRKMTLIYDKMTCTLIFVRMHICIQTCLCTYIHSVSPSFPPTLLTNLFSVKLFFSLSIYTHTHIRTLFLHLPPSHLPAQKHSISLFPILFPSLSFSSLPFMAFSASLSPSLHVCTCADVDVWISYKCMYVPHIYVCTHVNTYADMYVYTYIYI